MAINQIALTTLILWSVFTPFVAIASSECSRESLTLPSLTLASEDTGIAPKP
ncbi:hypothetical protein [[Leptolyngbya] sp. PCC 7376]|uniref:hypothetical protein n=1 Tax=[Leptolyngbya] sp. PCC 7376 TaxID=111781 RepID=UPI000314B04C|nr:hypothetical protein [[Leptolyngbya] sp. PCC 7376]